MSKLNRGQHDLQVNARREGIQSEPTRAKPKQALIVGVAVSASTVTMIWLLLLYLLGAAIIALF